MSAETDNGDEVKMVGARVPADKHQRIRVAAAERGLSIAEYLRELIDEDLDE